jgi:hypothetical protein
MSGDAEARIVIPEGRQRFTWEHLIPIAQLLIERGHVPITKKQKFGFSSTPGGVECRLTRAFTLDDWDAINERFVVPDNLVYFRGLIRDNANKVDMIGIEEISTVDGVMGPEEWEARERAAGRL